MGAFYLKPLDDAIEKSGLSYARFMDDWVIVDTSRWKIRKIVKVANTILFNLKIEKHPDKTFIGRADKGFDFLGYSIKPGLLSVSESTIKRNAERIDRLYEQGASQKRIRQYVRRWFEWLKAGISNQIGLQYLLIR